MSSTQLLDSMPEHRQVLLTALKARGPLPISELSGDLGISYEGVRQHLSQLELEGWVARRLERDSGPGRPRSLYHLTTAGDHLFPKEYEDLAVALIDAAAERLGPAAVRALLEEVARRKIEQWEPKLRGKPLEERLEALRSIYVAGDPFCSVNEDESGKLHLVERNCPFLEVARRRPALCSVTVSVLRRLLGREVVRVERFQSGQGRCVFEVLTDRPVRGDEPLFDWEPTADDDPE